VLSLEAFVFTASKMILTTPVFLRGPTTCGNGALVIVVMKLLPMLFRTALAMYSTSAMTVATR
jgi:hypothetical protein